MTHPMTTGSTKHMGHTPGPWRLSSLGFAHNDGSVPVLNTGEDESTKVICTVNIQAKFKRGDAYKTECEERSANARLIAAAPELLEAAVELIGYIGAGDPSDSTETARVVALRAAIAKATGGV